MVVKWYYLIVIVTENRLDLKPDMAELSGLESGAAPNAGRAAK